MLRDLHAGVEIKLRTVYCSKQDYNSAHVRVFLDLHYIFIVIYSMYTITISRHNEDSNRGYIDKYVGNHTDNLQCYAL